MTVSWPSFLAAAARSSKPPATAGGPTERRKRPATTTNCACFMCSLLMSRGYRWRRRWRKPPPVHLALACDDCVSSLLKALRRLKIFKSAPSSGSSQTAATGWVTLHKGRPKAGAPRRGFVVSVTLSRHFAARWSPSRARCSARCSLSRRKENRFTVRYVLTIAAVALVAALAIALVAPLFVDWTAHRAEVEARLGGMTGAKVAVTGPISGRLLPTPYLAVGEGSVSPPGPDAPKLSFASARLELALVKLASGAIRFTEIRLEKPDLTIARSADGALRLPAAPSGRAGTIGFDRLLVRGRRGRIVSRASRAARESARG